MVKVDILELRCICTTILNICDVPPEDAEIIADSIVYAHRREKHTHGVNRLPIYVKRLINGTMSSDTKIITVKETPIITLLDANHGFGQVAASKAMKLCIEKANIYGIGLVGVKNSNNFGTAGFIAEIASNHKMVGVVLSNASPAIAPWGGKKAVTGTNPLCVSLPVRSGKAPIVLDMATSVAARGKIRMAAKKNEKIPLGWALDSNGQPTDNPFEALRGTMVPIGDYKGYGLSLVIDIFAGLLTGSAFGRDVRPLNTLNDYSMFGHMLLALNIDFFMSEFEYYDKIDTLEANIKASGDNNSTIYVPGERSYHLAEKNDRFVYLSREQIDDINSLALNLGVTKDQFLSSNIL